jgi:hypothetical protein
MAITIEDNPKNYSPVYNKMEYLLSSTKTAETNFSYLVDVYINGSGTKTWRGRIPKRPSDDYCLVDIHRVLEATLTSDVGDTTSVAGTVEAPNSALSYVVKFGEEYDVAGVLTQYPDLTVDSTRYAINASVEKQEFIDWDITDYELDGNSKKFLTNSPDSHNVSINGHGWLYYKEATTLVNFTVDTFDSSGSAIATFTIDPTATSGTIQYVPSAPASLNKIDNANLISGVQPIITSSVASYTIEAVAAASAVVSETRTFVIKEPCKYNDNTLIFQNRLGGFDDFTFYLGDSSSYDIQKSDMKVNVDPVSGTSISYSMQEREKRTYYTKDSETIKLYSDWISEEEDAWLLELIESPEIYLQNGDDLIAVAKIKATSHKKRKVVRDKLFKLEVEIELGYDNYRQRG